MTGKVFNGNPAAFLILILPVAVVIVLLYKAWMWILGFVALIIVWKLIDNYQWQQWCLKLNPIFNQLLRENQGKITPMDLSLKTNLSAGSAKRFLARKAEEYGANCQELPEQGKIYYFITASTLGSIFDDSEPLGKEIDDADEVTPDEDEEIAMAEVHAHPQTTSLVSEPKTPQSSSSPFAQLAELKEERQQINQEDENLAPASESPPASEIAANLEEKETAEQSEPQHQKEIATDLEKKETLSLIQSDLAKRLDTTPSTIGRRKTDASFAEWSQSKDPEGIAWKYLRKPKVFVPIDPQKP